MLKVRSARPVICLTLTNLGTVPWPWHGRTGRASAESFSGLKAGSIMSCSSLQLLFCFDFEARPGYSIFRSTLVECRKMIF